MLELDSVWKFMECDVGMDGGGYIRLRAPCCAPARWVFRSDGAPNNAQQHQDLHRNRQRTPTRLWLASARTARRHHYHLVSTRMATRCSNRRARGRRRRRRRWRLSPSVHRRRDNRDGLTKHARESVGTFHQGIGVRAAIYDGTKDRNRSQIPSVSRTHRLGV